MHDVRSYDLRIKNYDISVGELKTMLRDGDFDLVPSFKEELKWNIRDKSKYVESALLQLPLKSFLFEEDYVGRFIIVDGAERITALLDYISGKYELNNLPVLPELEGKYYEELEYSDQLRLKRVTLSCDIISNDSNRLLKCEYLKRINLGKSNFLPQQARNFAFPKAHSLIRLVMDDLVYSFSFSIIEKSHGSRRKVSVNRAEQFILCMFLIQVYYYDKHEFESLFLGSALDQLCYQIEMNDIYLDKEFLFDNLQKVMDYLGFETIDLVYRNFVLKSNYRKNEISMNEFLCRFYEASHGVEFDTVRFNFYKEDMKLSKLGRNLT